MREEFLGCHFTVEKVQGGGGGGGGLGMEGGGAWLGGLGSH